MKKIFSLFLIIMLIVAVFSACSNNDDSATVEDETVGDIEISLLVSDLIDANLFSEELEEMDTDVINILYDIDLEYTSGFSKEYAVYIGNNTSEEIAIFRTASSSLRDEVEEKMKSHLADQLSSFEGFSPADADKIKMAAIINKGNYVIMCVSKDSALAKDIIKSHF